MQSTGSLASRPGVAPIQSRDAWKQCNPSASSIALPPTPDNRRGVYGGEMSQRVGQEATPRSRRLYSSAGDLSPPFSATQPNASYLS